jgi:hypothetical protein
MNELATTEKPAPFDLSPRTFEQALTLADYMAGSEMVPKQYRGRPGDCFIAIQWGLEIGLKPLQAMQSIAAINGKPGLYGDAGKALLLAHGCIIDEDDTEIVKANGKARCKITRPGRPPVQRTFSQDDAKTAGLWGKDGPWRSYPYRQMAWRAFWFAARDAASDLLRGMGGYEEALDTPAIKNMGAADEVDRPAPPAPPALPDYSAADFDKNLPAWSKVVAGGKKSASELLAMLSTKATFTEQQKARVLSLKKAPAAATAGDPPPADAAPATDAAPAPAKADAKNDEWLDGFSAEESKGADERGAA